MTDYALLLALSMQYNEPLTLEQFNSLPEALTEGQITHLKLLGNVNHDETKHITVTVFNKNHQLKESVFYYKKNDDKWVLKN